MAMATGCRMIRLEDLQPRVTLQGILPDNAVTVVSVQWLGSDALELTYKGPAGRVGQVLLYRDDEPRLEVIKAGRSWSFDKEEVMPLEEAMVLLREAEEERAQADQELAQVLRTLGLGDFRAEA
jgi:hypothetical protein